MSHVDDDVSDNLSLRSDSHGFPGQRIPSK